MTLTPKVTTEDLRLALNGVYSGSTGQYWFFDQSISSGSVLAQINIANYYLYGRLGKVKMDSTDEVISYHIKTCELEYSCMRVLVLLSGGVITEGFNWSAGVSVQQPQMLAAYKNLIEEFKNSALGHISEIQPIAVGAEWEVPDWKSTSPSVM